MQAENSPNSQTKHKAEHIYTTRLAAEQMIEDHLIKDKQTYRQTVRNKNVPNNSHEEPTKLQGPDNIITRTPILTNKTPKRSQIHTKAQHNRRPERAIMDHKYKGKHTNRHRVTIKNAPNHRNNKIRSNTTPRTGQTDVVLKNITPNRGL